MNDTGIGESESDLAQQRQTVRDSMFLLTTLVIPSLPGPVTARVRNLSAGGMMIETTRQLTPGDTLACELRGIGMIGGRVAWSANGRAGVAFDNLIDPKLARKPVSGGNPDRKGF